MAVPNINTSFNGGAGGRGTGSPSRKNEESDNNLLSWPSEEAYPLQNRRAGKVPEMQQR